MNKIFFTSDWHFCHNKSFIYEPRGFNTIEEMNKEIIKRHNSVVDYDDDVYCLGDCMLNNDIEGLKCIKSLKGKIHIIRGNHCTDNRIKLYQTCYNVVEILGYAAMLKYKKFHFYLSHYPTMTSNLDDNGKLYKSVINLYGHTHQKTNFYNDIPFMYHVGLDSHNCYPVNIDTIIGDIIIKRDECLKML